MKNLIQLAFLIILVTAMACEGPRNARSRRGATSDAFTDSNDYSNSGNDDDDDGVTVIDDGTGTTNSSIPQEIRHCQWSTDGTSGFQSSGSHLGAYTACQSTTNETDIYIQLQSPVTDSQLCVIPTFNNGATSIYIGEPRCLSVVDNKKIYKVGLLKNRPGYTNFAISSVMILKDKAFFYPAPFYQYVLSPDAFIFCSNYLDQYRDSSYCQAFKSVNEYQFHQF